MRLSKLLFSFFGFFNVAHGITKGINIYGLETSLGDFACRWVHPIDYYITTMHDLGFDSLRVPFSYEYVRKGDFTMMDKMFDSAHANNMTVVLDFHRVYNSGQSPVPTDGISELDYWNAWEIIAGRYQYHKELVALELFNEYQGSDAHYWNNIMKNVITYLEGKFPKRFMYWVGGTNWGGSLAGISLEDHPIKDRIRYTIHKYIFSGNSVPADWDISFGSYPEKTIVTEWGFKNQDDQKAWAKTFVEYLKKRGVTSTYYWCLAISGDTGGLWKDDCQTIEWEKYDILKTLWDENIKHKMLRSSI